MTSSLSNARCFPEMSPLLLVTISAVSSLFECSVVTVVPAADVTSDGYDMGMSAAFFMFCCEPSIMMVSQCGQDESGR
jgi:hypothetical protein